MKVFLSSTAYDLLDLRAKFVEIFTKKGHEVIFHESPTFPAKYDLHSHDQCIMAVETCDTLICILDKRYGGKYGDSDERDHHIPAQADHPFRGILTRVFRGKLTTPNA